MSESTWPKADRRAQERTRSSMSLQAARALVREARPSREIVTLLYSAASVTSSPTLHSLLLDAAATIMRLDPSSAR